MNQTQTKQSTKSVLESRCFDFFFFFAEILEKHQQIIFFFHIATSWRTTLLLQRLLKSQVVTKPGNYAELLLQKTPFFPAQPHQLLL